MLPSFYRISGNMFVINTGSTGPDLVVFFFLWILESSKIHIKSIAIGPESLISHLGMLKTHRDPKKQYKKNKIAYFVEPYWRISAGVFHASHNQNSPLGGCLGANQEWRGR